MRSVSKFLLQIYLKMSDLSQKNMLIEVINAEKFFKKRNFLRKRKNSRM